MTDWVDLGCGVCLTGYEPDTAFRHLVEDTDDVPDGEVALREHIASMAPIGDSPNSGTRKSAGREPSGDSS